MMLSKVDSGKKIGDDSGNRRLLNEIEAISKALYLDKTAARKAIASPSSRSKSTGKARFPEPKSERNGKYGNEDPSRKDKKSIWNWPLRAFSQVRNRRFNCCFTLQVHSIEGLPPSFNGVSIRVHWKRRDGGLVTRPVKVLNGTAEFEEKLTHSCLVHGSRSGPHHSAKYEAKHFLLYAAVNGGPELDLGKHRVDLTRLLPLTLEELQDEKSSGKWTTSFRLSGKAKGATMNVSFGYLVIGDHFIPPGTKQNAAEVLKAKENDLDVVKAVNKSDQGGGQGSMRRAGSLPAITNQQSNASSQFMEDIKELHEILPTSQSELATSVSVLFQKFDEEKMNQSVPSGVGFGNENLEPPSSPVAGSDKEVIENECEGSDFSVIERGIELPLEEHISLEEFPKKASDMVASPEVVEVDTGVQVACEEGSELHQLNEESDNCLDQHVVHDFHSQEDAGFSKETLMKELESALEIVSNLETAALDSPEDQEDYMEVKTSYRSSQKGRSLSLDDVTESVASEFLNMLGIEHSPFGLSSESEPESPREKLLRQFEKETLAAGCSLFDFDLDNVHQAESGYNAPRVSERGSLNEDFELSSVIQDAEKDHEMAAQVMENKTGATLLEDLETEALMREWGLNEKVFQYSPPHRATTSAPVDLALEEPLELPSLGEGLGPFLQTKNGGFLRSMNPTLFKNSKNASNLVMQVSNPVVVPAEMGSGVMEILQQLASIGIEKLSMQANKLMPLDDIMGKTMQQVAWEAGANLPEPDRLNILQHESNIGQDISVGQKRPSGSSSLSSKLNSNSGNEGCSEYVSLEDLAPLAMDKIEALSIEGLRIQSGMSNEDAPSNISARSIGEISALQGRGVNISGSLGLEGAAGLQLLDVKDSGDDVDGLMGLSLTLDEWMKLDSGEIGDEDEISERTSRILAAHNASSLDLIRGGSKGERRRTKGRGRKCGLLGNNFTVTLMVQLRDPLRNYEPVGAPMLALIQVERVFVPPKPKIYSTVSMLTGNSEEDDESQLVAKVEVKNEVKEEKEESIAQFKITEVHVAGLKSESGKKKLWGSATQQQSGSRWLVANGMGKSNKHPLIKSKAVPKSSAPSTTKVQPGDTLWSISSRIHGTGSKWKELAALNPHIRNPNVIFPNETIRLR